MGMSLSVAGLTGAGDSTLRDCFEHPPADAKPRTWWHWLNGNVSQAGITADLEAMQRAGVQEAQIFNVNMGHPPGPATYLSPAWLESFRFAAEEAQRLGLELAFHNAAGWSSSGGPWITPEQSMQQVVWTEIVVEGGKRISQALPQPETKEGHYRDIAVFAFPKPARRIAIDGLDFKSLAGKVRNHVGPDPKPIDPAAVVRSVEMLDLTSQVSGDGVLAWDAPVGEWIVLRLGHTSTGKTNHPGSAGGVGLECDKMSKAAVEAHWAGGVAPILAALGPLAGPVVNNILIDSYEVGTANWTPDFASEFARLRGYACRRYLPALAGYYVDSGEITERFLWDFRRTIGDLMAENYYGHFRDLCHRAGLKFTVEPYWGPFDNMQVGATGDIVACEFWSGELRFFDSPKFVASIANLKGSPIVAAEAFTSTGGWSHHPATLKAMGDRAWAQGINRFIMHSYVHQPWDVPPGLNMGAWGIDFNRLNTWWEPGKAFLDYIARSQFLLQQGRPVADVLVFAGEASPNDTWSIPGIKERGYDFDLIDAHSLGLLAVEDGQLTTPAGGRYRFLVLPDTPWMRPETLATVAKLARSGATIVGQRPSKSPSLREYPHCDDEVNQLATGLWDAGHIAPGSILQRLTESNVPPDFMLESGDRTDIDFIHRRSGDVDIYFVASSSLDPTPLRCRFRVSGKQPELWDAQTGTIRDAPVWQAHADGTTSVDIALESEGSVLVVFRRAPVPSSGLLSATVDRAAPLLEALPGLTVQKAEYGRFLPDGVVDVTAAISERVKDGNLRVAVNRDVSGSDPAPGYIKELRIRYRTAGETSEIRGFEREWLTLDTGERRDLEILSAAFGKFESSLPGVPLPARIEDVTETIRARVAVGQLVIPVDETLGIDRSVDASAKSLRIVFATDNGAQRRSVHHGKSLVLARVAPESRLLVEEGRTTWLTPHPAALRYVTSDGDAKAVRVDAVPAPLALTGPWDLRFPPDAGVPDPVSLDRLDSWSTSPDERIRHFSGTVIYRQSFELPARLAQPDVALELDLGRVEVMAEVFVNGTSLGVLWKQPFRVDLGSVLHEGENLLELRVTNLWPNRLIGDETLALDFSRKGRVTDQWPQWLLDKTPRPSARTTFMSRQFWDSESALLPSGLLGPVLIRPYVRQALSH